MPAVWKERFAKSIQDDAKKYAVVAVVDFENMPLQQLQSLRSSLRNTVIIRGGRKRLFEHALAQGGAGGGSEGSSSGIGKLKEYLNCAQPGLIFSNQNAFALAKSLKK